MSLLISVNRLIHSSFFTPADDARPSIFFNELLSFVTSCSLVSSTAPVPLLQAKKLSPSATTNRIQNL